MKTYYEDPTSPLKTVNYEVPVTPEDELRFEQRDDDERYAVLDAAVARGAAAGGTWRRDHHAKAVGDGTFAELTAIWKP